MTAAANLAVMGCTDDLPALAYDPRVTLVYGAILELDQCGTCMESHGEAPQDAVLRVAHDRFGMTGLIDDVCSMAHLHDQLLWLLRDGMADRITNVTVHIPANLAPIVSPAPQSEGQARTLPAFADEDRFCEQLVSLRQGIARMRNDGDGEAEQAGFESARVKALAYVQAAINDQIEQLGRVAA